jgi:hypothetical protein
MKYLRPLLFSLIFVGNYSSFAMDYAPYWAYSPYAGDEMVIKGSKWRVLYSLLSGGKLSIADYEATKATCFDCNGVVRITNGILDGVIKCENGSCIQDFYTIKTQQAAPGPLDSIEVIKFGQDTVQNSPSFLEFVKAHPIRTGVIVAATAAVAYAVYKVFTGKKAKKTKVVVVK